MEKSFADAFIRHLEQHPEEIPALAERAGVGKDLLYKLKYRKTRNPSVTDAIKIANAYGETAEEFMGVTPVQVSEKLNRLIGQMSSKERAILEASIASILASRDLDSE